VVALLSTVVALLSTVVALLPNVVALPIVGYLAAASGTARFSR
jgi:membrane protein DedA with SNARE-associated domain